MQASASSKILTASFSPKLLVWIALAVFAFLFIAGFIGYAGSKTVYLTFTFSFSALLLSGIFAPSSYSYLFLTIFLWLGFWFKFTANFLLFGFFPFGEPVGYFDESAAAWDHAFWIAIVASSAVLLTRLLYKLTGLESTITAKPGKPPPIWYSRNRSLFWLGLVISIVGLSFLNAIFGIQQSGLVPRTRLPWPLNAVIYWLLSTGLSMAVATLLWWDIGLRKNLLPAVGVMLGEALFSTVTLLSRSIYLFHAIPQLLMLMINRRPLLIMPKRHTVWIVLAFLLLFAGSVVSVSFLRDFYYSSDAPAVGSTHKPHESSSKIVSEPPPISSVRLILLHQLIVNRWIGMEGVLAVSSYPEKSPTLFVNELTAHSEIGKVDGYQKISNSTYQEIDGAKYQFSSLPGATAFFYYSGSAWYVFGGMFFLTFIAMCSERLVLLMTGNVVLCALYGVNVANAIAQLGVTPRQLVPHLGMIAAAVVIIWAIQSSMFTRFVTNQWRRKS